MRTGLLLLTSFGLIYVGYSFYSSKITTTPTHISENPMHEETTTVSAPPLNAPAQEATLSPVTPLKITDLSTQQKVSADKAFDYFKNRLQFLEKCFQHRCKLPNTDSRSYDHAVHMEIENTLETLKDWQSRHHLQDRRISSLALSFLSYQKSEIKVTALEILATQPKDERLVSHILKNVIHQAYPKPVPLAIKELARYKNSKQQQRIDSSMIQALTRGSVFSAIEIAQHIEPLLTPQNRPQYEDVLGELAQQPLSRGIYAALKDSLRQ